MHSSVSRVAPGAVHGRTRALAVAGLLAIFVAQIGVATAAAGISSPRPATQTADYSPSQLKVAIIVGPTDELTDSNLRDAEALAQAAETYGMDVRRIFYPNATWDDVVANVQGANLLVYMGHGNGWPSPYAPFQEDTKNGIGVAPYAGGTKAQTKYYGSNVMRSDIQLAPNAVVFLNHLCYAAGNGESGMAIPNWDVAHQRNDNFAAGFLASGARTVFAYSWQLYIRSLRDLMTTDKTMKQIFETPGAYPRASYGWIGADARVLDSVRTPGTVNYLDRDLKDGFLRAVSGDLSMTAGQWRGEQSSANLDKITIPPLGPTAPSQLRGTPYNGRYAQLTWSPATMTHYGAVRYTVVRNGKLIAWTTNTYFNDQPTNAGSYTYVVRAVDAAGIKGPASNSVTVNVADTVGATLPPTPKPSTTPTPSPTPTSTPTPTPTSTPTPTPTPTSTPTPTPTPSSTPTPTPDPPTVPLNFSAVVTEANAVNVSWTSSTASVVGPVSYRVFRNGKAIGTKITATTSVDQPAAGASYTYKVRAIDAAGVVSAFSTAVTVQVPNATQQGTDTSPPTTPAGLTAVSMPARQIYLSWVPSTDDSGGAITYRVWRNSTLLATVAVPVFIDQPDLVGTYTYTIRAVDVSGNRSAFSSAVKGYAVN